MPARTTTTVDKEYVVDLLFHELIDGPRWCEDLIWSLHCDWRIPHADTELVIEQLVRDGVLQILEVHRQFEMRKLQLTGNPAALGDAEDRRPL